MITRKLLHKVLILLIILSVNYKNQVYSNIVYINNQTDFDKYKKSEFQPGTTILFAAGKIFNGEFSPTGSGVKENPIKITAYDPKTKEIYWNDIDNKPVINGNGQVESSFYLYNEAFWEINNLEITNTNGTDKDQGDLKGIYIKAEDCGIVEDITIKNCYIHDVNGKVEGKKRGGIHIHVIGKEIKTKFENLLIENNIIKNIGGVGIGNYSSWGDIKSKDFYPWTNFVIRGNRVENTGRNGIITRAGYNQIVEYNVLAYNSRYSTGHSLFDFGSVNCIMQYNEAYGNTGDISAKDHGGFDADFNTRGTIIQYNYSHDNNWFTHYFKAGLNASIFASPGKVRTPSYTYFYNNIFYFEDKGGWGVEPDSTCEFSNNLFYNVEPKGKNPVVGDPLFVNPGEVKTDIDMKDPERLSGYRLKKNSPCIDAGILINDNGGKDFWGNKLGTESIDIGACESKKNGK